MNKYDLVFFVSDLQIQGGTTFVKRFSKYARSKNKKILIFCLTNNVNEIIYSKILETADVVFLKDYIKQPPFIRKTNQLSLFFPLRKKQINELLDGTHIHILGVFGLYFLSRLSDIIPNSSYSIGLYHQNEFKIDKRTDYFSLYLSRLIRNINPNQIIFFNDNTKCKFGEIWDIDTNLSIITPIGIEIGVSEPKKREGMKYKLVSVGNLVGFKSYNKIVISLLPELIKKYPLIQYNIIGDGPELKLLSTLCDELNIKDKIIFHGALPFDDAMKIVEESDVFIGSGTAILESSIRYIPSIIGVECELEPYTYGFIYHVKGLDYNEKISNLERFKMIDCINDVLSSDSNWLNASTLCNKKASEFSIEKTYNDFFEVISSIKTDLKSNSVIKYKILNNCFCFVSFLQIAILDYLNVNSSFKLRRNINEN